MKNYYSKMGLLIAILMSTGIDLPGLAGGIAIFLFTLSGLVFVIFGNEE